MANATVQSEQKTQKHIEEIDPNSLMDNIGRSTLTLTIIVSLVLHIFIIGLTSIHYIYQCNKYKTFKPEDEIKKIEAAKLKKAKAKEKKERMAKAIAAEKERIAKEKKAKAEAKKHPKSKKESQIEKDVNAVSNERPETGGLNNLDDEFDE